MLLFCCVINFNGGICICSFEGEEKLKEMETFVRYHVKGVRPL
jgi:hypothetical protein